VEGNIGEVGSEKEDGCNERIIMFTEDGCNERIIMFTLMFETFDLLGRRWDKMYIDLSSNN
jgi:hypothetical protein